MIPKPDKNSNEENKEEGGGEYRLISLMNSMPKCLNKTQQIKSARYKKCLYIMVQVGFILDM